MQRTNLLREKDPSVDKKTDLSSRRHAQKVSMRRFLIYFKPVAVEKPIQSRFKVSRVSGG